jgi:hypothetical protein
MTGFRDKFAQKVSVKIIATIAILIISPVQAAYGFDSSASQRSVTPAISDLEGNGYSFDKISSDFGQIEMFWTAPGDDADSGRADHYVIKYSTSEINDSNWDEASTVADPPSPLDAGSEQNYVLTNLIIDQLYYVAIKSYDEAGNLSPISNVINKYSSGIAVPLPMATEIDSVNGLAILQADAVNSHLSIYYEFALDTVISFTSPIIQAAMIADSTVTTVYAGLTSEISYFWRCRAMASDHSDSSDWSNALSFSLAYVDNQAPQVALTFPNGGDSLETGLNTTITWDASDNSAIDSCRVEFKLADSSFWAPMTSWIPGNPGSLEWDIPGMLLGPFMVKVTCIDSYGNIASDSSDSYAFIEDTIEPTVAITYPIDGDTVGSDTLTFAWNSDDNGSIVGYGLGYSIDNGQNWQTICYGPGDTCHYQWQIPQMGTNMAVRVLCADMAENVGEDTVNIYVEPNTGIDDIVFMPGDYYLSQAYPNPFNPSTTIGYGIPEASHVKLDIYDILGNLVATLVDEYQPAGFYQQVWRADNLSSGTYIYRIETGQFRKVGKAMLLK